MTCIFDPVDRRLYDVECDGINIEREVHLLPKYHEPSKRTRGSAGGWVHLHLQLVRTLMWHL
jgi:hypothetical protein